MSLAISDGVLTAGGEVLCAEIEEAVRPWLFASDRPDLTVGAWIDRGGGDLLWGLLGPTRAQVLGLAAALPSGSVIRCGGRVVKNVAGYDLTRALVGARGRLGRVLEAHLRIRPAPRGWRAAVRQGTEPLEARTGPGCAVWADGATWRFLRKGEGVPGGYEPADPLEARRRLRASWQEVRSFRPLGAARGIELPGPGVVGSALPPAEDRGPLWERLEKALR
jgi:FAD/FMN-containing dehydrogenase